jgi:nicotinamide/nicotinate riboside kinase
MKPVVVALGGLTNGGKSTIAKLLQDYFPLSKIKRQDDYFKQDTKDEMEYISELGHYNWDIMSTIDMNKFESEFNQNLTVLRELRSKSLLFLEAFLVLNYKPLRPLMDLKYFLELEYDVLGKKADETL